MEQLTRLFGPSDGWYVGPMGLVLVALAAWRVTSLLVEEEGPWDIFCKMRHALGVRYDAHSQAYGLNVVGKALCCVWCTSVWVGTAGALCLLLAPTLTVMLSLPLAFSAMAILLNSVVSHE